MDVSGVYKPININKQFTGGGLLHCILVASGGHYMVTFGDMRWATLSFFRFGEYIAQMFWFFEEFK